MRIGVITGSGSYDWPHLEPVGLPRRIELVCAHKAFPGARRHAIAAGSPG